MPLRTAHSPQLTTAHEIKQRHSSWHDSSTLWHSECAFCCCKLIQGYEQTCSEAQPWIYGIVIPTSCHPSKRSKVQSTLASFAWMAAGRDDNDVYPPLGIRACLYIPFNESAITKSALGMSQCVDVMANATKLHPRCQAGQTPDMAVG